MKNYGRESVNGACLPCRPPARPLGVGQYPGALKGCGVKTRETIEEKITLSINNIMPKVVRECLENVHKGVPETVTLGVKQLWSETVYGSDFPELDNLMITQRQANRVAQKEFTAKPYHCRCRKAGSCHIERGGEKKGQEKKQPHYIWGPRKSWKRLPDKNKKWQWQNQWTVHNIQCQLKSKENLSSWQIRGTKWGWN